MRMMSIASGSSGNCIYIGTDTTHILVDDGVSRKKVLEGLKKLDLHTEDIDAVLITHEHDDHISGLGVLERCISLPVYGTSGTLNYIRNTEKLGRMPEDIYMEISPGNSFNIGDICISSVATSHDAAEPVAYTFSAGGSRAGIITDSGMYTEEIIKEFSGLDAILIEANHDINMLMAGPYPYALKRRILSEKGHLSNEDCGRLLVKLIGDRTKYIFLGHLSRENNFSELAYETVRMEIELGETRCRASDFDIRVADRILPSDIINF